MKSLDKKQIKRMVVEVFDAGPGLKQAKIRIRVWNATGCPLSTLPPPEGGERNAPISIVFSPMDLAVAPVFIGVYFGRLIAQRGASANSPVNASAHTEIIYLPANTSDPPQSILEIDIGPSTDPILVPPIETVVVQCGNATWAGEINIGSAP